jgi:hypothetical protein
MAASKEDKERRLEDARRRAERARDRARRAREEAAAAPDDDTRRMHEREVEVHLAAAQLHGEVVAVQRQHVALHDVETSGVRAPETRDAAQAELTEHVDRMTETVDEATNKTRAARRSR